ncbi:MAG: DUF1501 domain-containing protein [Luteolibacter sp.]
MNSRTPEPLSAYGPFALGSDPAQGNFQVRDLSMPAGVSDERFDRRRSLLETVDHHFRTLEKSDALDSMDAFYQHAYKLISSQQAVRPSISPPNRMR